MPQAPEVTFSVGVTGHRPNRLAIPLPDLSRRLALTLAALRTGACRGGSGRWRAITALAEGADRLFATSARGLGYAVEAVLPFPSTDYETTFSDAAATPDYRTELSLAHRVTVLPGSLSSAEAAYEAAGLAILEAADVLLAVWDGKPSAGRGGTTDIIGHALAARIPVIWIDAIEDRMPRRLELRDAASPARDLVMPLARRARPMTRAEIAALVQRVVTSR
ncbi:MAG: hypothetical protein NW205_00285 [Hyphomicrobiaceae bacterium]|nr:hypothetical protein [Hyphomicrobiaceae bacterium]